MAQQDLEIESLPNFKRELHEMTAILFVEERESRLADAHGIKIPSGEMRLTFEKASELVFVLDQRIAGGINYKRNENRLRALRNSLLWSFGPTGEDAYANIVRERQDNLTVKKEDEG